MTALGILGLRFHVLRSDGISVDDGDGQIDTQDNAAECKPERPGFRIIGLFEFRRCALIHRSFCQET